MTYKELKKCLEIMDNDNLEQLVLIYFNDDEATYFRLEATDLVYSHYLERFMLIASER